MASGKKFRVVPDTVAGYMKNQVITEEDVKKVGGSVEDWLSYGSIIEHLELPAASAPTASTQTTTPKPAGAQTQQGQQRPQQPRTIPATPAAKPAASAPTASTQTTTPAPSNDSLGGGAAPDATQQ